MWSLVSQISLQCGFCQQHFFGDKFSPGFRPLENRWRWCHYLMTCDKGLGLRVTLRVTSFLWGHKVSILLENLDLSLLESSCIPSCIISWGDSESGETRMSAFTCPIDVFSLQDVVVIDPRETRSHIAEADIRWVLKATLHRVRAGGWKSWCSSPWSVTCSTGSLETTWRTLTSLSWRSGSGEVSLAAS